MATYRDMVYMVLDMLKLSSDDAFYTEDHVLFILKKVRATLLLGKYGSGKAGRDQSAVPVSDLQEICLDLELSQGEGGVCGTGAGRWLRSVQEIPSLLGVGVTSVYPFNAMLGEKFTLVPIERLPFVGKSRWLKRFIYAALGPDGHLYLTGASPTYRYMKKIRLSGVFEDTDEADELSCDGAESDCEPLDRKFPLEEGLQAVCIEYAVQELSGSRYAPQDRANNAKDDLSDVSAPSSRTPVGDSASGERAQRREARAS